MKKMAVIFLVMLLNLNLAYADENKLDIFAKSPLVSGLVVKRDNSKLLYEYTMQSESFKGDFGPDTLADANFRYVFKTNRSLIIKYQGFNPLEVAVKLESKDEKTDLNDPGSFFEILSTYRPIFLGKSENELNTISTFDPAVKSECKILVDHYAGLVTEYNGNEVEKLFITQKTLDDWKAKTTSAEGINGVVKDIGTYIENLTANVKKIKNSMKLIEDTPYKGKCDDIPVIIIAQTSYIMNKGLEAITEREAAARNLKELSMYLSKYADEDNWDGKYYKIGEVTQPSKQNLKKVTISLKQITVTSEDNKIAIKESDNSISNTFTVFRNEKIVFEPSVAFVYSPLKYNKFSTNTVNGNQVVEKTESSDNSHAAIFLNVFYTEWLIETVYPFWQIGLATAKEYPALLTGLGMKFRDTSFAVSVGAAFGFTKELDKLSEGSPVSGQAVIDEDEKLTVRPNWYLSIQYSF